MRVHPKWKTTVAGAAVQMAGAACVTLCLLRFSRADWFAKGLKWSPLVAIPWIGWQVMFPPDKSKKNELRDIKSHWASLKFATIEQPRPLLQLGSLFDDANPPQISFGGLFACTVFAFMIGIQFGLDRYAPNAAKWYCASIGVGIPAGVGANLVETWQLSVESD